MMFFFPFFKQINQLISLSKRLFSNYSALVFLMCNNFPRDILHVYNIFYNAFHVNIFYHDIDNTIMSTSCTCKHVWNCQSIVCDHKRCYPCYELPNTACLFKKILIFKIVSVCVEAVTYFKILDFFYWSK